MSINYTTLFTRLGVLVSEVNLFLAEQALLLGSGSGADKILDQYEARRDLVTGVQANYNGFASAVAGWEKTIKGVADTTLQDLQTSLNTPTAALRDILPALYVDMVANSKTVKKCNMTASVDSAGVIVGTGTLIASVLGGENVNDERVKTEVVEISCIVDRFNGGTLGSEKFKAVGYPAASVYGIDPLGSGSGASMLPTMASQNNLLTNGGFETFATAANIPDGWTLTAGTAGTNTTQSSSTTLAAFSVGALQFKSNASATTVTLTQNVTLQPKTLYCFSFVARKTASCNAGSTFTVKYTDAQGANKSIAFDPNALTTSYVAKSLFFATGNQPGSGVVTLTWTSASGVTNGEGLYIDDLSLSEPYELGHAAYAIIRGATGWVVGDFYKVTTTNDHAGTWQSFFGRFYDFNLPSATSGSETISDSLAS